MNQAGRASVWATARRDSVGYLLISTALLLAGNGGLTAMEQGHSPLMAQAAARGCCVLRGGNTSCAYTSQAYCEKKSRQSGGSFDFKPGKSCRDVPACR